MIARLLLATLVVSGSLADAADPVRPARTDSYGDPLPPGVLARLGSVRFRPAFAPDLMEWSPDGSVLAFATRGGRVAALAFPSGLALRDYNDPATDGPARGILPSIQSIRFLPDSGRLLVLGDDRAVEVDLARDGFVVRFRVPQSVPRGTLRCVSDDGKLAVVQESVPGRPETALLLHDLKSLEKSPRAIASLPLTFGGTTEVALSPDGRLVAYVRSGFGQREADLEVCDLRSGRTAAMPTVHGADRAIAFAPDGRSVLLTGSSLAVVHAVRPAGDDRSPPHVRPAVVLAPDDDRVHQSASFFSDSRSVLVVGRDGAVRSLDPATRAVRNLVRVGGDAEVVRASADGRRLAVFRRGMWAPEFYETAEGRPILAGRGHVGRVTGLVFSPDGRTLHSVSADGTLRTWNAVPHEADRLVSRSGATVREERWAGRETAVRAATNVPPKNRLLSGDGTSFASIHIDRKTVSLIDLRTGAVRRTFSSSGEPFGSAAFHPDGRTLLTADARENVSAWDLATGRRREAVPEWWEGLARRVWIDGSAGGGRQVFFRDASRGRVLARVEGRFESFSISRDERTLVAVLNQRVALIEVDSGRSRDLTEFAAETDRVPSAVAMTPDGTLVAVGYPNGEIALLDLRPHARDAAGRPSAAEWRSLREGLESYHFDGRVHGSLIRQYPAEAVAEIRRLKSLFVPPTRERLALLLARLDDDDFRVREAATRELRAKTPTIVVRLQEFLNANPSAEAEARVRRLLEAVAGAPYVDEDLRDVRMVGLLEAIGTPRAKALLWEYADDRGPSPEAMFSARDALVRLGE